jgi:hypothetical protein
VRETEDGARKTVVAVTRAGQVLAYRTSAPACSPGSWPRFHHDNANSGVFDRDAVAPGRPTGLSLSGGRLSFGAVGDDLMCGRPARYEVFRASTAGGLRSAARRAGERSEATARAAGLRESALVPEGRGRYVGVRAVDDQGNVGPLSVLDTRA